jgi:acyl-CoA reductase-like NAD-dependent aldehyde dehydrogenase
VIAGQSREFGGPGEFDEFGDVGVPRARQMLQLARWAAQAYARYDIAGVRQIAEAVARAAEEHAERYARWTVQKNGFGVVADKTTKNLLRSRGLLAAYRDHDYVSPRTDAGRGLLELPRPAGVVVCQLDSTDAVATVYATALLALLTRNALVLSPDPAAAECGSDAARILAAAAVAAGAPDGVIQVAEPTVAVRAALIDDERADLVLKAERPSYLPAFVDATADLPQVADKLLTSKAFDNSVTGGGESVLIVEEQVAEALLAELRRAGGYLLTSRERDLLRANLFPDDVPERRFDPRLIGQDAGAIAGKAGISLPPGTRVLLAPLDQVLTEEPLAHEKPCPVIGVVRVRDAAKGIRTAVALLRIGGPAGRAAVIHSRNPRTVLDYAATVRVPRVILNEGADPGGAELEPEQLIRWTRIDHPVEQ